MHIHTCTDGDTHTHTHRHRIDTVKLDIALGLIMDTRTAKYLTPRLSVCAANIHKHQLMNRQTGTHVHQSLAGSTV